MADEDRTSRILHGPLAWEALRFGLPLALGMGLQTSFNLVDAYLIAQLPREEVGPAVGALGVCDQLAALGTIVSYGVTTGAGILLSQAQGRGDRDRMNRIANAAHALVLGLALLFGVVGVFGAGFLVKDLVGAKGEVGHIATRYLRVIVGGSFSIFLLLHYANVQRALGSAKTPVALLALGNLLNVFLCVVFVFGEGPAPEWLSWGKPIAAFLHVPRMGMVGAAWATVIARTLVLVPTTIVLHRRFGLFVPRGAFTGLRKTFSELFALAWPSSIQFVVRIGSMLLVGSIVARYFTTHEDQTAQTAIGLVFRLDTMALFLAMGWGTAAQTFVGQSLGAGMEARGRRSGWVIAGYDAATNVVLWLLLLVFARPILRLFDDDPAPLAIAVGYVHVVAPAYLGLGLGIVLGNAIAGAGATRTTLLVDVLTLIGLGAPLMFLVVGPLGGSLTALFVCVAATNAFSGLAYAFVYARGRWLAGADKIAERSPVPSAAQ